jgi:hypothetical protein
VSDQARPYGLFFGVGAYGLFIGVGRHGDEDGPMDRGPARH